MTTTIRATHRFNCATDDFWRMFLDTEANREIYLQHMQFEKFDLLSFEENNASLRRRLEFGPRTRVPSVLRRLIGDQMGYIEEGAFVRSEQTYRFRIEPKGKAPPVEIAGTVRASNVNGATDRVAEIDISCALFGVGAAVERFVSRSLEEGLGAFTAGANTYLGLRRGSAQVQP